MTREIIQGIVIGLLAIVCVVSIGSFIGFQLSHGPADAPAAEQPATEAPAN
ncbi:MAG: hypothetical protein H0U74_21600 [Bradymonadaceae bacterium]|nr:hypothetical protein [Lujinxingiaceae bacterium]